MKYSLGYWNDVDRVISCIPGIEKIFQKSVLITGATGMICSSVADILFRLNMRQSAGIKICLAGRSEERTKARFPEAAAGVDYQFLPFDATKDEPLVFGADYLIHGASNAHPSMYTKQPVETMLANINGLNVLLSSAVRAGSKRLLYVSSSEVYGNKQNGEPYREADYGFVDILNPRACYPSAKRAGETLCVAYGQEYGLETVIVRPGHIYGPSITQADDRASAQFTRCAAMGKDIVMKSTGTQLRSYCYTLDCASAIISVLMNGENGSAYNISNRDSVVTISDVAHALADAAKVHVTYEASTVEEGKGYNMMSNSSLNAEMLEKLGWKAVFGLNEGAAKTLCYF